MSTLERKLDKVFSAYIRLRDAMPNGYFRCISCGQIKPFGKADCGHYFSRTHMNTRWDELNAHAECNYCNRFRADHLVEYRQNLIKKIGEREYMLLQLRSKQARKWTDFELRLLIERYKNEVERLSKEKGIKVKI